ncbi:MAG: glycosyl transferase family 1 [Bryobacteraceae bacterium]|nr:MAG: glycosyl transferase family 1 [Bryobacteraceae bacterium]
MNVLSLSTVFPRPDLPRQGLFVARRLQHLAARLPVEVIAPVPLVDLSSGRVSFPTRRTPPCRREGRLRVHHPPWWHPPGLGRWNAVLLARAVEPAATRLRLEFPFDLIDAHFAWPEGVAASELARHFACPYTVTLRGCELVHGKVPSRRREMEQALRRAAAVIAVSRELLEFALELGAVPDRSFLVPNGVDASIFHPQPRELIRARLSMQPHRHHLVSAGHLIPGKGHHRLAALLPELARRGLDVELWILGDPGAGTDQRPHLHALRRELGLEDRVHVLPSVPPEILAQYMSAADLVCLASEREGWPNVVHEALACGTPVVATRVGAVPDLVCSPDFGRVVPPGDDRALAEAIIEALRTPFDRERIARHGASRSWDAVAEEIAGIFEKILAETP